MTSHTAAGTVTIGIDDIELATSHHVVRLDDFAEANGTDPNKFRLGLGQDEFSFPAPDEDVVTMAAAAAAPIIQRSGTEGIRTLLFATESGIDQSKAAGMAVHSLLDLASQMRVVEVKEACYSATAALQAAVGIVTRSPGQRVLVIAADVARYELDTPGEPTQGAGAVAMLVSADPKLLEIEPVSGLNSADVDDFWRPNDSTTAIVDGALSVTAYLDALTGAWTDLAAQGGPAMAQIDRVLYHQPFTKMAKKAQVHLAGLTGEDLDTESSRVPLERVPLERAPSMPAPRMRAPPARLPPTRPLPRTRPLPAQPTARLQPARAIRVWPPALCTTGVSATPTPLRSMPDCARCSITMRISPASASDCSAMGRAASASSSPPASSPATSSIRAGGPSPMPSTPGCRCPSTRIAPSTPPSSPAPRTSRPRR
jgi:3-oxoacyl-[acyl-carrier-protein] synthase III